jgi:serine O-acetyltransferase
MSEDITERAQLSQAHDRGCLRSARAVRLYLRADLHRYHGGGRTKFWRHFLFTPGFKYTVWMRWSGYARVTKPLKYSVYPILKLILSRCRYKYGIAIPEYTDIGPGLFINRFGGIYMNGDAIVGANANIAQMTMLAQANRGSRAGSPILGDRVYVAAGSSVIGRIHVGEDVVIGINSVVTKDTPANSVVAGTPAKVISQAGAEGYVNRVVPDALLAACYAARG